MAATFKFGDGNWAVKEDYALAYNDQNGNFKPLPFDFTRASTSSRINKDGLLETMDRGMPRIDFLNNANGHLLLEPSRTNYATRSEDFTHSYWLVSSMTVTPDDTTSPYGTQTAAKIEATGTGSVRTSSYTGTDGYAFSIFVKKGNSTYVTLRAFGFTTSIIVGFNLDTLTAQTGGVIEDYGNDWYRLSISKDISSDADKSGFFYIYLPDVLGQTTSVSGNYAYFFGAQIEDADYSTSYIKTSGSTVTRVAETANGSGNSTVFNDSEGVLYAEIEALANDSTYRLLSISDGGSSNRVFMGYKNTSNELYFLAGNVIETISQTVTDNIKVAFKYKSGDSSIYINGTEAETSAGTMSLSGMDEFAFDSGTGSPFYGKIKDVRVYDTALSDSELQALTS